MTTVYLASSPKQRFVDANGNALVGGQLYSYAAGTSTPQPTYTDSTGSTANANPIVLDSRGECSLWLDQSLQYKFVLKDSAGNLIWTVDNAPNASLPSVIIASAQAYTNTAIDQVVGIDSTLDFRNRLRNGNFAVNQRGVSGTVTLGAGAYGHDGWKAGAAGCTYTFATSGIDTTLTISAGSLQQVVESGMVETGTVYTLRNQGTALGRLAVSGAAPSGAYASTANGLTSASHTGGTITVEFSTGTLKLAQLEPGSQYTVFDRRPLTLETLLCQRYYQAGQNRWDGLATSPTSYSAPVMFKQSMRAAPSVSVTSTAATSFPATLTVASTDANGFWEVRTANASGAGSFASTWTASAEL